MLLTDGCPNTVEDLRAYESGILNVGSTELIDLKTKLSLAKEDIAESILDFLLEDGRSADPKSGTRRSVGVSDVVVTRHVKRWHALQTLAVVYRDALHNQLNTRYQHQYDEYQGLAREARGLALRFGIGVVSNPVPAADVAVLTAVAGTAAAETYYVRVSWLGASGQAGAPGVVTALQAADGTVPSVEVENPPAGATGFNVYAGVSVDTLYLQNPAPVEVGQPFVLPGPLVSAGPMPGEGQSPDVYVTGAHVLRRG